MTVKDLLLEFPAFTVALDPAPAPALDEETILAAGGTYYLNPLDGEPPDADAAGNERPALPPRSASCDQGGGSAGQEVAREMGGVPSRTFSAAAALARVDDGPGEAAAPAAEPAAPAAPSKPKETDSYADVDDELLAYLDLGDTPAAPPAPPASRHITKFGQEDASLFSDAGSSFGGSARGSPAVGGNSPSGFGGPVLSGMNALSGSTGGGSPMVGGMARRSMGMDPRVQPIVVARLTSLLLSLSLPLFPFPAATAPRIAEAVPYVGGCAVFPSNNAWNIRVDRLPVHPRSAAYVRSIGLNEYTHPDFGSGQWDGGPIGIPVNVVTKSTRRVFPTFYYGDESERGPKAMAGVLMCDTPRITICRTAPPSSLPSPALPSSLPSPALPSSLPSPALPSSLPSPALPSSLPSPALPSSLPSPALPSSLPSPALPSSLPSPALPSSLPSPALPSSLPSPALPSSLPSLSRPSLFPSLSRPSLFPSLPSSLPSPALPSSLPSPALPSSLPSPALPSSLPSPALPSSLPSPAPLPSCLPGAAACGISSPYTPSPAHALRFTAAATQKKYVWPARHYASDSTNPNLPPMGLRLRLKKSFNISGFPKQTQVILQALKTYGMMLADNGAPWYISGAPHAKWDNDDLHSLHQVLGKNYEVVDMSSVPKY
ncbi:unnamed protein product [Closterium sp. Yama58-4]|nr:unnamed protein product [Closterium sp. Yama58-4]